MGTNYYATKGAKEPCECCGRPYEEERLHIGKSSGGWCFSLHIIPEMGINDWLDWERELASGAWKIVDEYGDEWELSELRKYVTERKGREDRFSDLGGTVHGYHSEDEFHRRNHSERGPNGLLRHQIKPETWTYGCVKHGEGTWDCITGEFR